MRKIINQKNTLLNHEWIKRFKIHKMNKLIHKFKRIIKDNQKIKEEKIKEIEVVEFSLNLKKITKIIIIISMMNILIIKEINSKKLINKNQKIMLKDKTNNINKKVIIIKMMIISNKEMKREKCLIMNKKYLIKVNFKLMKIKSKEVKDPIFKTKKIQCWDQQVL